MPQYAQAPVCSDTAATSGIGNSDPSVVFLMGMTTANLAFALYKADQSDAVPGVILPFLRKRHLLVLFCAVVLGSADLRPASGQAVVAASYPTSQAKISADASTNDAGVAGIIPFTRGFNASLVTSSEYDHDNGWSSVETPGAAYRFNQLFSISASVPIYAYIHVSETTGPKHHPVYVEKDVHAAPGDVAIGGQFNTHGVADYNGNLTIGMPTGEAAYGLGAGKVTFDINNHFERGVGIFSPDIEFGIGSSSRLVGARVHKSYTAVGLLAHFQAGASVDLPHNMSFEADAYEQLAVHPTTLYSATRKRKTKVTTPNTALEDNGITSSLDIPVSGHVTWSGFYYYSLRNDGQVAGISLTFLLKAPPKQ